MKTKLKEKIELEENKNTESNLSVGFERVVIQPNDTKIILDLCGGTGSWSKPYRDAGYKVLVITLPEWDVRNFREAAIDQVYGLNPYNVYGILAAPPCTHFSLARTTAKTPRDFKTAMETVQACMNIIWNFRASSSLKFWALENPMGYLRQFLGKPAFTFDPSEFGADYNKKTDLWGYFNEPKKICCYTRFDSTDDNTRKLPEIPEGYIPDPNMKPIQIKRSITPVGFASSFYEANK